MNATAELTDRELDAKGDKLFADLRAYLLLEEHRRGEVQRRRCQVGRLLRQDGRGQQQVSGGN